MQYQMDGGQMDVFAHCGTSLCETDSTKTK